MKGIKFGVEIEMTNITREQAAKVASRFLGGTLEYKGGSFDEYHVTTSDNRVWKFVSDASIVTKKKDRNIDLISAGKEYSVELVTPILIYDDMEILQELIRQLRHAGAVSDSKYGCSIHVHTDASKHTPATLRNLINLVASKEELIYKSLDVDPARFRYCKKVNEEFLKAINKKKPQTMQELADIWYAGYGNESRSRHYHNSRYFGTNYHSLFEKGSIEHRWSNGCMHAGVVKALIVLCLAISHQALTQKSASPRRTKTTNDKYTMRCWLLRLRLIGDEYKNVRMHILKNLKGDSAWRHRDAA